MEIYFLTIVKASSPRSISGEFRSMCPHSGTQDDGEATSLNIPSLGHLHRRSNALEIFGEQYGNYCKGSALPRTLHH